MITKIKKIAAMAGGFLFFLLTAFQLGRIEKQRKMKLKNIKKIWRDLNVYWKLKITIMSMLLLSACAKTGDYGTETVFCSIPLPSVSTKDTEQTIIEVDNYAAKVDALCDRS